MNASRKTSYQKAKELISKLIVGKNYQPGDKLPSRVKLSSMLDIGLISVQQAVKILEKEGVLSNIRGSGCYIKALPESSSSGSKGSEGLIPFDGGTVSSFSIVSGRSRITLRFALFPSELEYYGGNWKILFAKFQKIKQNICIEPVIVPSANDLRNKQFMTDIDIFQIPQDSLPFFADAGFILPPEDAGALDFQKNDFFKVFHDSSVYGKTVWGIPTTVSSSTLFINRRYSDFTDSFLPVKGFWNFLEKLEERIDDLPGDIKSFIANGYTISGFLANCPGKISMEDFSSGNFLESPCFLDFIRRFEKYYRNCRIFHPDGHGVSGDPYLNFIAGRSLMALGNSTWISNFNKSKFRNWGIIPEPVEPGGYSRLNSVMNVISAFTYYPAESLEFLNYLGSYEAQKYFAEIGRPVANRKACSDLSITGLDGISRTNLIKSFETGRINLKKDYFESDFTEKILHPETIKWYDGAYSSDQFFEIICKKKRVFYNVARLRMNATMEPLKI